MSAYKSLVPISTVLFSFSTYFASVVNFFAVLATLTVLFGNQGLTNKYNVILLIFIAVHCLFVVKRSCNFKNYEISIR
jgi:hypothetical protein